MLHDQNISQIYHAILAKVDFTGFAIFSIGSHLILDQAEFYHSEALKSGYAACEI